MDLFDLLNPDPNKATNPLEAIERNLSELGQAFNMANEGHVANYTAIILALFKKGLLTQEEYDEARMEAIHEAEQEFARKRDHKDTEGTQ